MGARVTPKELKRLLKIDLERNSFIPFLWGAPGVGKSTIVKEVGAELGLRVVILSTALEHPHVLGGMPAIIWREKVYEKLPPRRLANLKDSILFLDDFGASDPAQQRVALNLTTYRSIGDHPLHPSVRIVFASNRVEDASHIIRPSMAVLNRMKHYVLIPSLPDWVEWVSNTNEVDSRLLSYAYAFLASPGVGEKSFSQSPQEQDLSVVAYPTPRSWFNLLVDLTHLLRAGALTLPISTDEERKLVEELTAAWVGEKIAQDFVKTLSLHLKDIERILQSPESIKDIPHHLQVLHVLLALSYTEDKGKFLMEVCNYIPSEVAAILASILRQSEMVDNFAKVKVGTVAMGGGRERQNAKHKNSTGGERRR